MASTGAYAHEDATKEEDHGGQEARTRHRGGGEGPGGLEQRPGWIVGNGCDGLVIIRVRYAEDGLPEEREDRQGFERVASGYIAAHAGDLENCEVYFDSADFHIMGEHALMRHHVNCFC